MDELVKAAIAKWPNVPACSGWLGLDARGDWFLRDLAAQAAGPFPHSKGSRIEHERLREFIARNYEPDAEGRWYFQNGPQRVYVELEAAPLVLGIRRVHEIAAEHADGWCIESHTGLRLRGAPREVIVDELGRLYLHGLDGQTGLGLVRSADMDAAADALLAGCWRPVELDSADLPQRYGHCLSPLARAVSLA